jgi:DNA-binding protein H-NS
MAWPAWLNKKRLEAYPGVTILASVCKAPMSNQRGVIMAKKAKRRGRPPGSKNKKSIGKSVATMDVLQLRAHIDSLQSVLAKKVSEQRAYFQAQLAQLGGYTSKKGPTVAKAVTPANGRAGKRAKPKPKYQSKKNASLKWTGRGMTPVWMREEMKGTKLKKDDFLMK